MHFLALVIACIFHGFKVKENVIILLPKVEVIAVVRSNAILVVYMCSWPVVKIELDIENLALKQTAHWDTFLHKNC